ncbi:ADP-ribose 1''-phosphate phosphatase KNAG_0K01580 [Huiozyma naganishii CBS 8797]|uniref:ADP-ribose 1''-phosphate phosphatase n=1 Tax=Huiozyma naganishii (strain ATCC MYA-139 / BCRC 22969 / CBS 8797 / KCTC 17520 / NBRC 10181 / NCYC 3082 / Yp74L-3) TaxID=1071383 RepID=J7SA85_HUIN7|nr:hypothetical protein KNAG_0K01580 [Kazachstania naganishii CBS 8797]CCK72519.1 hypothetical protein KNAG_0K01580 [Kazachstania naganishii CBS 8797]
MGNITYLKGNILAEKEYPRILLHSCNCSGSWGGGIAYQLACRFPEAEKKYVELCENNRTGLLGKCRIIMSSRNSNLLIGCLFTAPMGGCDQNDETILRYTRNALKDLARQIKDQESLADYKLEMPKINSGIFGVPWEQTESILHEFAEQFTVYVL